MPSPSLLSITRPRPRLLKFARLYMLKFNEWAKLAQLYSLSMPLQSGIENLVKAKRRKILLVLFFLRVKTSNYLVQFIQHVLNLISFHFGHILNICFHTLFSVCSIQYTEQKVHSESNYISCWESQKMQKVSYNVITMRKGQNKMTLDFRIGNREKLQKVNDNQGTKTQGLYAR